MPRRDVMCSANSSRNFPERVPGDAHGKRNLFFLHKGGASQAKIPILHPRYSLYQFLHSFAPLKALQTLKLAVTVLPQDPFMRLFFAATAEEYLFLAADRVAHERKQARAAGGRRGGGSASNTALQLQKMVFAILKEVSDTNATLGELLAEEHVEDELALLQGEGEDIPTHADANAVITSLYEDMLGDLEDDQVTLAAVHFIAYLRRAAASGGTSQNAGGGGGGSSEEGDAAGSRDRWREQVEAKVLGASGKKLGWEVHAAAALTEYHVFQSKERCASLFRAAVDRYDQDPTLVSQFASWLQSLNDFAGARQVYTLAIQHIYKAHQELGPGPGGDLATTRAKSKLQAGFR